MKRHTGRISCLSKEIRDTVNNMMLDGATYAAISTRLAELGHPQIKSAQLSRWYHNCHQDWLDHQERLLELRQQMETALQLAEQSPGDALQQAGLKLAALRVFEVLLNFKSQNQTAFLAEHPENFVKLLSYLPQSCRASLDLEKCLAALEARKTTGKPNPDKYRKGLTPETLRYIEEKLNLM